MVKVKVHTFDTAPLHSESSPQKCVKVHHRITLCESWLWMYVVQQNSIHSRVHPYSLGVSVTHLKMLGHVKILCTPVYCLNYGDQTLFGC